MNGRGDNRDAYRSNMRELPCLLSRLTDANPLKKQDSLADRKRLCSQEGLKSEILSNIELILNSRSHLGEEELGNDQEILSSVLAMGLNDRCGVARSGAMTRRLVNDIAFQIRTFEPRLDPASIKVELMESEGAEERTGKTSEVDIRINARINVDFFESEIQCVSKIDLELGRSTLQTGDE